MTEFHYFSLTDINNNDHELLTTENLQILQLNSKNTNYTNQNNEFNLNITYTAFEILVGIIAVIGNLMVIVVFKMDRKLRRRTNYYIVSLAVADFLVGLLGVPFALLASIGQPQQKHACLLSLSTLVILCTISIFCLVAVSVDRYWAILYPMAYSRNVRTKTAISIISMCWVAGTLVGLLPLFGIHQKYEKNCFFEKVMDYDYLLFLYFATIITPALLMLAFYAHIYRVIVRQIRQIVTMNPIGECSRRSSSSQIQTIPTRNYGGTMLRVLGAARKRDVKATQNLSIIVLFFMICWIPLYTINCITAFNRSIPIPDQLKMCCIILTHLNSAVNPILYAYHLKDFRAALKNLILKVFGIEIEQPPEIPYRLSVASQHRLQSINDKRTSIQNRIYVDSPIWLKQQQQLQSKRNSTISCSLNSVHNTVAAVASATADINRDIWKIIEVPTSLDNDDELSNNIHKSLESLKRDSEHENHSQFSYDNKYFSSSGDDLADYDEIFIPKLQKRTSSIRKSLGSLILEKLHPPIEDHYEMNNIHNNTILNDHGIYKKCELITSNNDSHTTTIQSYSSSNSTSINSEQFKNISATHKYPSLNENNLDIGMNLMITTTTNHSAEFNDVPLRTLQQFQHPPNMKMQRSQSCCNQLNVNLGHLITVTKSPSSSSSPSPSPSPSPSNNNNIEKFTKKEFLQSNKQSSSLFHIYNTTTNNQQISTTTTRKRTTSAES